MSAATMTYFEGKENGIGVKMAGVVFNHCARSNDSQYSTQDFKNYPTKMGHYTTVVLDAIVVDWRCLTSEMKCAVVRRSTRIS